VSNHSQLIHLGATAVVSSLLTLFVKNFISVGSANFDNRSFRLNDEANLNVFDRDFALEESAAFEKDRLLAREITWEEWKRRPMTEKITDATVALLRSQL